MAKETKMVSSSVNLPIDAINSIVNVDDRRVEISIDEAANILSEKKAECIRSLNTLVDLPEEFMNQQFVEPEYIKINHTYSYINNIEKKKIGETNELKFYKLHVEFSSGLVKDLIVPSYVKFYSSHKGMFIAVEHLKSRDILVDYSFKMVKVEDAEEIADYQMPEEYWNIKVAYDEDEGMNFYLDGILANVSYNNFNKVTTPQKTEETK